MQRQARRKKSRGFYKKVPTFFQKCRDFLFHVCFLRSGRVGYLWIAESSSCRSNTAIRNSIMGECRHWHTLHRHLPTGQVQMLVLSLRRKAVSQAVKPHPRERLTYVTQSFGDRLTIVWRSPEDCLAVANRSFDKCRKTCGPRCAGERAGRLMAKGRGVFG